MKSFCALFLCVFFVATYQDSDIIKGIQSRYAAVNAQQKTYRKIEKVDLEMSTEGVDYEGYYAGDTLQLLVLTVYGEMGKEITSCYFDKGQLVFVYDVRYAYAAPLYDKQFDEKKSTRKEHRYYFHQRKMIRWVNEHHKIVSPGSKQYAVVSDSIWAMVKDWRSEVPLKK